MCCKNPFSVSRCYGCPGTDWNSFTWRLDAPASRESFMWGDIERKFEAVSVAMLYPGTCACMWINYTGEVGRDTTGALNDALLWFPIASIGILRRERTATGYIWAFYLSRYEWNWTYFSGLWGVDGIVGWNWSAEGPGTVTCEQGSSYLAPGYPGYGVGFGWGLGYGYGFDPLYWGIGDGMSARYTLDGSFDCGGTNRFVRQDSSFSEIPEYIPDSYPEYLEVTKIALDRVL